MLSLHIQITAAVVAVITGMWDWRRRWQRTRDVTAREVSWHNRGTRGADSSAAHSTHLPTDSRPTDISTYRPYSTRRNSEDCIPTSPRDV